MVSANQIPGFLNQPFIQHKSMELTCFLHAGTISHKLKDD